VNAGRRAQEPEGRGDGNTTARMAAYSCSGALRRPALAKVSMLVVAAMLAVACGPDADGPMGQPTPPALQTPVPVDPAHPADPVIPMPPDQPGTMPPTSPTPPPPIDPP
jgi:hypothetical protein